MNKVVRDFINSKEVSNFRKAVLNSKLAKDIKEFDYDGFIKDVTKKSVPFVKKNINKFQEFVSKYKKT